MSLDTGRLRRCCLPCKKKCVVDDPSWPMLRSSELETICVLEMNEPVKFLTCDHLSMSLSGSHLGPQSFSWWTGKTCACQDLFSHPWDWTSNKILVRKERQSSDFPLYQRPLGRLEMDFCIRHSFVSFLYFQRDVSESLLCVKLKILSNWGHPKYTCLYRFRVHGTPGE